MNAIIGNTTQNAAEAVAARAKPVPKNVKAVKPIAKQFGVRNRNLKKFYRVSVAATKTFNWLKRNAVRVAFRLFSRG